MARPALLWPTCVHDLAHTYTSSYTSACTFRMINCSFIILNVQILRHLFKIHNVFLTIFQAICNSVQFHVQDICRNRFPWLKVFYSHKLTFWLPAKSTTANHFSLVSLSRFTQTADGSKFCGQSHNTTPKYQHITPILLLLHWLLTERRIKFQICLIVHRGLLYI